MNIIITAGGTKEPIDNVRSITNSSSGALGLKIANEIYKNIENANIFYIHGSNAMPFENANNYKINSVNDLILTLELLKSKIHVDIFIHAMAVSDYTTEQIIDFEKLKNLFDETIECGNKNLKAKDLINMSIIDRQNKISSNISSPGIILKQTPKVISQIKKMFPLVFLVGFKLLDNVDDEELFNVGFDLLRKNRCNLVLANDISKIRSGNHEGLLIYPEKNYDKIIGKDNIANFLIIQILKRFKVKHPKSIQKTSDNKITEKLFNEFYETGKKLNSDNLLPVVINHERTDKIGTYGNLSRKCDNGFYITCRNVDKRNLNKTDLSFISSVNFIDNKNIYSNVYYNSILKPSIDTSIHAKIYNNTDYKAIIHIHTNKVFLGYPFIDDAFPCGCDKEMNAIIKYVNNKNNIIQMKKHGLIILGNDFEECLNLLNDLFSKQPYIDFGTNIISAECSKHIKDVNANFINEKYLFPIKINNNNIGCLYEKRLYDNNDVNFGIYTNENVRGKNLNIVKKYLNLYKDVTYVLNTTKKCNISDFYKNKFNFSEIVNDSDTIILKKKIT